MRNLILVILGLAAALSGCAPAPAGGDSIEVREAWVRTAPGTDGMGMNGALFMTIKNIAGEADVLMRVETQAAHMAEVHLTEVDANGVTSMHEVEGVEIPAKGQVEFKSGSYHVMLMGLKEGIQPGTTASFTLYFKNAGAVVVEAPVKSP